MSDTASPVLAPWLERALHRLLTRRGHAWLLQGPSGLGQYELGLALAQAWLCLQPTPQGPCGQCASCHGVEVRAHPDLCVLMPEVLSLSLGWPLDEATQDKLDKKERKPSKEIRVEAARDMVRFTQSTRSGGTTKVVLIYPAERMNAITANTLLKTLEEPPGETRFVLVSEAAHGLLPTIRSRCQTETVPWPTEDEALAWLAAQGLPATEAPVLLQAAGGRPQDALALAEQGLTAKAWAALPQAIARGEAGMLSEFSAATIVGTLQKLCHDMMLHHSGAAPRFFDAAALPPVVPLAALSQWSRDLARSLQSAAHPFHAGLLLDAQLARARQALRARAA